MIRRRGAGDVAARVLARWACPGAPATLQQRWKSSGKSRWNMQMRRATEQHVDYMRQLDPPKPYRSPPPIAPAAADTEAFRTRLRTPRAHA